METYFSFHLTETPISGLLKYCFRSLTIYFTPSFVLADFAGWLIARSLYACKPVYGLVWAAN